MLFNIFYYLLRNLNFTNKIYKKNINTIIYSFSLIITTISLIYAIWLNKPTLLFLFSEVSVGCVGLVLLVICIDSIRCWLIYNRFDDTWSILLPLGFLVHIVNSKQLFCILVFPSVLGLPLFLGFSTSLR